MIIENFQAEFYLWILLRMATNGLVRNTVTVFYCYNINEILNALIWEMCVWGNCVLRSSSFWNMKQIAG